MSRSPFAPGELEFVRAFVNSLDVEDDVDRFRDAEAYADWLSSVQPADPAAAVPAPAGDDDLAFARDFREALRESLLANHDQAALPAASAALLTEAARRSGAEVHFDASGPRLETRAPGVPGVLGRVVAAVAAGMADGTWSRLKACRNDTCRWVFYDHSRSRTGQWCSMAVCGNRAKQSRWREQRRP